MLSTLIIATAFSIGDTIDYSVTSQVYDRMHSIDELVQARTSDSGEDPFAATALVSALSKRPARHDIAMTGEVTLRGRVLPIGGVKEKVLGAVRAGIRTIILPKENEADLQDLPEDVRKSLDVHAVEELGEVLSLALRGARFEEGHLVFEGEAPVEPSLVSKN